MPSLTAKPDIDTPLRRRAEARIQMGDAPGAKVAAIGPESLAVLYRLATDSENPGAAIKLLHELQVHQVELDLQHEQLEQSRKEQAEALDRYIERYDFAPVGFCVLGRDGEIVEANMAAAELFGVDQSALTGCRVDSLVAMDYRTGIYELLKRLRLGGVKETCEAVVGVAGVARPFQIVAKLCPSDGTFLVACIETPARAEPDSPT